MQILKYYINYKGGTNNRLVCRIVNHRLETVKTFSGRTAERRSGKYIRDNKHRLLKAYNQRGTGIDPYAADAKKMPVRRLASIHIHLTDMGLPNFSVSGDVEGMRRIYGKGALMVRDGDYIYNVTSAPDIYYCYSIPV